MTIEAIKENGWLLLECISGSHAYGLATEDSDVDLKGVFYLPRDHFYGLQYVDQVSNATNDEVYYELGRFVELLIKNNPNLLELLATPAEQVLYRHPIMDSLRMELFLSRLCKETFAGYALTQIRKARGYKKIVNPVEKEKRSVVDFCFVVEGRLSVPLQEWLLKHGLVEEQCGLAAIDHARGLYALFCDESGSLLYRGIARGEEANDVCVSSIPKGEQQQALLYFNQDSYSIYCREYREYWEWVAKRNEHRFANNETHGNGYDAKNMMHTIRLLQVAEEIMTTGRLQVRRPNRDELLAIKAGEFAYDELLSMADALMVRIEEATKHSALPATPDAASIEAILVKMREQLYHG